MANPKVFNGRIVMKHDTESNWNQAVNFKPMEGELIVLDADDTNPSPRLVVGDGEHTVIELLDAQGRITEEEIDAICGTSFVTEHEVRL
jgi:hypothetical protein